MSPPPRLRGLRRALAAMTLLTAAAVIAGGCLTGAATEGERLYRRYCSQCHGLDAAGNTVRFMGNPYADLTDDHWRFGGDPAGMEQAIRNGVGEMPGFSDLSTAEIRALVNHVRELRGESPVRYR